MAYSFNELCRFGAPMVNASAKVNAEALLWAIGGVESSHGKVNVPRHEQAYCMGGRYHERNLYWKFGCMAHCSWGPWQIMFTNVWSISRQQITPMEMADPHAALFVTIEWLNRVIRRGAGSVAAIADAWNSGTHRDNIVPHDYIDKVVRLYEQQLAELGG